MTELLAQLVSLANRGRQTQKDAEAVAALGVAARPQSVLDALLDEIQHELSDPHTLMHLDSSASSDTVNRSMARLFQLLFFVGVEADWPRGTKEGAIVPMALLIDRVADFKAAADWGKLALARVTDLHTAQLLAGDVGLAYAHLRNFDQALSHLNEAIRLAELRDDHANVAKYLADLGAAFARVGAFAPAIAAYMSALSSLDNYPDAALRAKVEADLRTLQATNPSVH